MAGLSSLSSFVFRGGGGATGAAWTKDSGSENSICESSAGGLVGTNVWGGNDESTANVGGDGKTKSHWELKDGGLEGKGLGKGAQII